MKKAFVCMLSVVVLFPLTAIAQGTWLRFRGGIGVIPVSSGGGQDVAAAVVNRNIVRGVQPAGQIWRIADLDARISADGRVRIDGRGLLLAGGNNIGGNANASVFATLICEAATPFTARNTSLAGVPLGPDGDFRIDDVLDLPTAQCASPVLLIRNAANQSWFAAGIPDRDRDER
jgi:hypothetical protein